MHVVALILCLKMEFYGLSGRGKILKQTIKDCNTRMSISTKFGDSSTEDLQDINANQEYI